MKAQLLINYYNFLTDPLQTYNRSWRHGTSGSFAAFTRDACFDNLSSNQVGPEVAVIHPHKHCSWVARVHLKHYDVPSIQLKYPRGEHGALLLNHWLYHGNCSAIYHNIYPESASAKVDLCVYVVPPRNRHDQSAIAVVHTSSKVSMRSFQGPVSDH